MSDSPATTTLHATCVEAGGAAIVLTGASGAGKSDLALRLLHAEGPRKFRLVADDSLPLERRNNQLVALAPRRHAGLIEVRGLGLVRVPFTAEALVKLVVSLRPWASIERYPGDTLRRTNILGLSVPTTDIDPQSASAVARVMLALDVVNDPRRLFSDD
ncbi:MAG: HPr kinase/phosphatase C-terminal domain-containing protein [Hyphomicrobiales bacterium]